MGEVLPPKMYLPCKYRLYPFPNQERELLRQFDELRFLWNHAIEQRCDAWRKEKKSLSYVRQCRDLARWRAYDQEGVGRVYGHVAQETLARLDDGFKHFFRRVKEGGHPGFPRFKREVISLTYPDANGSAALVSGRNGTRRLHLAMLGDLPVKVSREPPEGRVKTCTVKREGDRWFAVLTVEVADPAPPSDAPTTSPVGVDLGLSHLATLSTGEMAMPPRFLRRSEKRLGRAQRVVSRRKKGSHNREKAKLRVVRCHAKVRDQRRDFAHKTTTGWVKHHDLIAFEDLSVPSMLGNGHLSKSISDAGWGMLRQMSKYKEARRSGRYAEVPAKGTTQTCSKCGRLADPPLPLQDRTYSCPCGLRLDRDLNAAKNILARALAQVPGGTGESTPVEIVPPPHRKGRRVRSKRQEPPRDSEVAR
ncbi:MAG TPA: transposase [Thermoplasmata archaeon]|nr:transposase [Thermoplasmata archaeon]